MPGEVLDGANISMNGARSVVATLQLFEHDLTQMGHRESSFSATNARSSPQPLAQRTRTRPPHSGFIQSRLLGSNVLQSIHRRRLRFPPSYDEGVGRTYAGPRGTAASFGNMSERIRYLTNISRGGDLQAQLRSETNTAVVSASTVAAPVFELNVDSRVAASLEFCWSG
jgi:hypothetical protein